MKINPSDSEIRESVIKRNITEIKSRLKVVAKESNRNFDEIKLMAVVKNVCDDDVKIAIREGIKLFGESRLNHLKRRHELYVDGGVSVHFIGHLQTNKVKEVVLKTNLIESVDSFKLAEAIGKSALLAGKVMPILLEVNVGNEASKFGFLSFEVLEAVKKISKIEGVKIKGLMAVPPKNGGSIFFEKMRKIFVDISSKKIDNVNIEVLSMGMSDDFEEAIVCGSSLVRIGRKMFI